MSESALAWAHAEIDRLRAGLAQVKTERAAAWHDRAVSRAREAVAIRQRDTAARLLRAASVGNTDYELIRVFLADLDDISAPDTKEDER